MKKNSYPTHTKKVKSNRLVILAAVSFLMLTLAAFGFRSIYNSEKNYAAVPKSTIKKDSVASVKAFEKVYAVLMSPRCVNCHPIGDIPLQGDDSHLHKMFPKRGEDGKGVTAMKCANCHQAENIAGPHTPPGNPNWHLPPANMKMIFEGRTANQLAKQLIDKKQNGNKDTKQLLEHADDGLVLTGWNPTEGNSLPPLSHSEFKKAWITWLNTGAYAPAK